MRKYLAKNINYMDVILNVQIEPKMHPGVRDGDIVDCKQEVRNISFYLQDEKSDKFSKIIIPRTEFINIYNQIKDIETHTVKDKYSNIPF